MKHAGINFTVKQQGFTLIELLVGMVIVGIIFVIAATVSANMTSSSRVLNAKSELTQDAQVAERIIISRLAEAVYIYPPGTVMRVADSGITTDNILWPANDKKWTVNQDPFVAMILPPQAPIYAVGSSVPNNCTSTDTNGCYRFYAYFATRRKQLTDAAAAGNLSPSSAPAADSLNDNAWVIMQYQKNIVGWTPSYTLSGASTIGPKGGVDSPPPQPLVKGNSADVLLDYVEPQVKSNADNRDLFSGAAGATPGIDPNCVLFCVQVPAGSGGKANNGRVEFRYRMLQSMSGRDITVTGVVSPGATRPYLGGVASPRNWWQ